MTVPTAIPETVASTLAVLCRQGQQQWNRYHRSLTGLSAGDRHELAGAVVTGSPWGRGQRLAVPAFDGQRLMKEEMTTSTQLSMSAAEQLLAIEAIKRVKHRYAYSADQHDWHAFASVFTQDAVFDESSFPAPLKPFSREHVSEDLSAYLESMSEGAEWPVIGRDAIHAQHVGLRPDHMMVHHLLNPDVELTSDTTATALFRFESHHWFPEGGPVQYMHNFGAYHETYVRLDDGQWYIQELRLERRRVECR